MFLRSRPRNTENARQRGTRLAALRQERKTTGIMGFYFAPQLQQTWLPGSRELQKSKSNQVNFIYVAPFTQHAAQSAPQSQINSADRKVKNLQDKKLQQFYI